MADLRQGVTRAAHNALDELEDVRKLAKPAELSARDRHYWHIAQASRLIAQAKRTAQDNMAGMYCERAAAHLIRFAEEQHAFVANLNATRS